MLATARAERTRRLAAPLAAGAVAVAAAGLVGAVDPHEPGRYPVCPFLMLTGLPCPGCGGLRAAHDLVTGDLAGAVGHNALAVAAVPLLAALWLSWLRRAARGRPPRPLPAAAGVAVIAVVVLFGLLRLVPGAPLGP